MPIYLFNLEVEDESTIMARLESELAEILPSEQVPDNSIDEDNGAKSSKKEKKKKKSAKDSPDMEAEPDNISEQGF